MAGDEGAEVGREVVGRQRVGRVAVQPETDLVLHEAANMIMATG